MKMVTSGGDCIVGTAGWSIASRHAPLFPGSGSHLERYARQLDGVEINSSFYRPHRRQTYERWSASVPEGFRFSVKLPKTITHERRLADCGELLDAFLGQVEGLGDRLGVLLVQLPPNLPFDSQTATSFLRLLRERSFTGLACEPRHPSWFTAEPDELLASLRIARVAADPAPVPPAARPGGWSGIAYFRWHGSPRIYRSNYPPGALDGIGHAIRERARAGASTWCIFDNTTEAHALQNAVALAAMLGHRRDPGTV